MNNSTVAPFVEFAKFLDARHDQYERIFKLSRDITIESKRAIFLLHRIQNEENEAEVLAEAKRKLDDIRHRFWFYVAKELQHGDPYLFQRAYTQGLQEYIEALSFYHYIKEGNLITWKEVQENLSFHSSHRRESAKRDEKQRPDSSKEQVEEGDQLVDPKGNENQPEMDERKEEEEKNTEPSSAEEKVSGAEKEKNDGENKSSCEDGKDTSMIVMVSKQDFLLGIADLTGEMMRKAVTSAAAGNTENCFAIFTSLQVRFPKCS
jgi:predicted translin family RNA/ssDNA-binding protein